MLLYAVQSLERNNSGKSSINSNSEANDFDEYHKSFKMVKSFSCSDIPVMAQLFFHNDMRNKERDFPSVR